MKIGSLEWNKLIADGAKSMEIDIDPEKIDRFALHAEELVRWTQKTNLTSITDPREIAIKHFLDSIAPAAYIPPHAKLLDIGSGGGFPGLPLKVLIPSLSVTLIDAVRKKVSFLNHVIRQLSLKDIEAYHLRVEQLDREHQFDAIITRALFSLEALLLQALPLLINGGYIIAMKGRPSEAESEYARLRSTKNQRISEIVAKKNCVQLKRYTLPFTKAERTILMIKYGNKV